MNAGQQLQKLKKLRSDLFGEYNTDKEGAMLCASLYDS